MFIFLHFFLVVVDGGKSAKENFAFGCTWQVYTLTKKVQNGENIEEPEDSLPTKPNPDDLPEPDDTDILNAGKADVSDAVINTVVTEVSPNTPKDAPTTADAPTPAPVAATTTKPKKPEVKAEPADPNLYYVIDWKTSEYQEEPESAAVYGEEAGKKSLDAASLNKLLEDLTSPTSYGMFIFCANSLHFR